MRIEVVKILLVGVVVYFAFPIWRRDRGVDVLRVLMIACLMPPRQREVGFFVYPILLHATP